MKQEHLAFAELPLEAKKALLALRYMDCESMQEVEDLYQGFVFELEWIPVEEAKKRCMEQSEDLWGCKTFDDYHQAYLDGGDIPNHGDSMYPVIEGGMDEWLDDGWHRFHSYVLYGKKEIPVLRSIEKQGVTN